MEELTFETAWGWMKVVVSSQGIVRVYLPNTVEVSKWEEVGKDALGIAEKFKKYFEGERVDFKDLPLDLNWASDFAKKVYKELLNIPYGKIATYGQIAKRIGDARFARAVGQALARNKIPIIIPCHRIVGTDGKLGGFAWGVEYKRRLLELEGVEVL